MTLPRSIPALVLALAAGCRAGSTVRPPAPSEPPWFEDVAEPLGLRFRHEAGPTGQDFFMPQVMGSRCAFLDFDNDGLLDIYLLHNAGPKGARNQLFHQERDGTFRDVSAGSGLDVAGHGLGVAVADVNNDGLPDLLLTEYGASGRAPGEGGSPGRQERPRAALAGAGAGEEGLQGRR